MSQKIVQYYSPVLRKKAKKVEAGEETSLLIKEMKETLKKEGGVGLAAPQIGISKRVIIFDSGNGIMPLLNPEIVSFDKETALTNEGCLSLKGIWLDVVRSRKIEVVAQNEKGEDLKIEAEDIIAIILQHEIDHLNGKLFVDRTNFFIKSKALFFYFLKKIFKK